MSFLSGLHLKSNFLAVAAFGEHVAKQALGHTANSSTIFRAYRRAITETSGKKYFGKEPEEKKPEEPKSEEKTTPERKLAS